MKRARFVVAFAVVLITVVSTGPPVRAKPGALLSLYRQSDQLGPHEAIASLSLPVAAGPSRARVGFGEGFQSQAQAGPDVRTTNSGGTQSEISMAATGGGQNIVLAYNGGPQGLASRLRRTADGRLEPNTVPLFLRGATPAVTRRWRRTTGATST